MDAPWRNPAKVDLPGSERGDERDAQGRGRGPGFGRRHEHDLRTGEGRMGGNDGRSRPRMVGRRIGPEGRRNPHGEDCDRKGNHVECEAHEKQVTAGAAPVKPRFHAYCYLAGTINDASVDAIRSAGTLPAIAIAMSCAGWLRRAARTSAHLRRNHPAHPG